MTLHKVSKGHWMAYKELAMVGELEVAKSYAFFLFTKSYVFFIYSYLKMQLQNMYKCVTCEMITRTGSYSADRQPSHRHISSWQLQPSSHKEPAAVRGIHTNENK